MIRRLFKIRPSFSMLFDEENLEKPWTSKDNEIPEDWDKESDIIFTASTPFRTLAFNYPVGSVKVPAADGDMVFHPNHTQCGVELRPGVMYWTNKGSDEPVEQHFIAGGLAGFKDGECKISIFDSAPVEDIDVVKAREKLAEFEDLLPTATHEAKQMQYEIAIETYKAMIYAHDNK